MSEQENIAQHAALHAHLRLFCQLMLGSTPEQIYRRAFDDVDEQENRPSERVRLFRMAADLRGACRAK
jgi:hypothetical protein